MIIAAELINNPAAGGREYDWRWRIWNDILKYLKSKGHTIYNHGVNSKARENLKFQQWDKKSADFYISFSPYGMDGREQRYEQFKDRCVVYDHGWLYKSLVVDRNKLFGDSYYRDKIANLIEEDYNEDKAENYRIKLLNGNLSKRPQPKGVKIPKIPYIFIPFQVLKDASVVYYSKTGMLEFVDKVIDFASRHGIDVVGKLHPGMDGSGSNHGKDKIVSFCKDRLSKHKNFHIIDASIYDLMERSLFTACISSGSIIDNIVSHTPVYICGRTFFNKSGSVIANENIEEGLKTMIRKDYDWNNIVDKQKKLLWWLRKTMIQEEFDVKKNVELLEYHSGIKF